MNDEDFAEKADWIDNVIWMLSVGIFTALILAFFL